MKTLFTADLHFGHVNILKYEPSRYNYLGLGPHDGVEEMNEALVELWNSQVDEQDLVVILGDVVMGKVAESLDYVSRLKGEKILIPGNHDRVHPMHHKPAKDNSMWDMAYAKAGLINYGPGPHIWDVGSVTCLLSHFPHTGDNSTDERYPEWRPTNRMGLPLVHGHIHGMWKTNGMQFNVGIDAWDGRFITPEEIGNYFKEQR